MNDHDGDCQIYAAFVKTCTCGYFHKVARGDVPKPTDAREMEEHIESLMVIEQVRTRAHENNQQCAKNLRAGRPVTIAPMKRN